MENKIRVAKFGTLEDYNYKIDYLIEFLKTAKEKGATNVEVSAGYDGEIEIEPYMERVRTKEEYEALKLQNKVRTVSVIYEPRA